MKNGKPFPIPVRTQDKRSVRYSCERCPAYCCTYTDIEVRPSDIERLARHFDMSYAAAEERFTKVDRAGHRQLRHRRDRIFDSACMFLDQEKRRCTVYAARPGTCRKYPDSARCGYYEFLKFEREQQGDPEWIALT